jgi:two-component system LytT family response regulator
VIFTTAYDQYALKAFEVNSIDYLLKPIDREQLRRALGKLERLRGGPKPEWRALVEELAHKLQTPQADYPDRIASRVGERVYLVELASVTHFFAKDKLTYAVADGRSYAIDHSIAERSASSTPSGSCASIARCC